MMARTRFILALMLCGLSLSSPAASVVLYDDTSAALPGAQAWLLFGANGAATPIAVPGQGVNLTTSEGLSAGFSNTIPFINIFKNGQFPSLDRNAGFRLDFELTVVSETHSSLDRAGFNVTLLSSDGLGVQLGFWSDEIWAQLETPLLTHGEFTAFDTGSGEVNYALEILNNSYDLRANGNSILSGGLKDYSAFGSAPYTLNNFLFLGDDTSRAGAEIILGRVELATMTTVPLPLPVLPLGCCLLITRRLMLKRGRR